MIKNLFISFALLAGAKAYSQCATNSVAVSDVTLQCSGGTSNRSGVAFFPTKNTYYSIDAGSAGYPIETFTVTGGSALSSVAQGVDYRGFWYNPNLGIIEGNTYNSTGIYSHNINPSSGYATGTTSLMTPGTMPNPQSCGAYDPVNNIVLYYDATTLYKYSRTTGSLIGSMGVTGLPSPNVNIYGVIYTGIPGSEVGVYDYSAKAVYFINSATGAYVSTCLLPSTAPAPSSFKMGYTNNRLFLYDGSSNWIGYKLTNQADIIFSGSNMACSGQPVTINVSGASTYTWSTASNSTSISVNPNSTTIYSVAATNSLGCTNSSNFVVSVGTSPTITAAASGTFFCGSGTSTLSVSGASSYSWSTGATTPSISVTPTATTIYSVSATGTMACSAYTTISITVENNPTVTISGTSTICSGNSTSLTALGATNYTWSTGSHSAGISITPSATAIYSVMGTSPGGCAGANSTATINVSVNANPTVNAVSNVSLVCIGNSATITASGATTYSWNTGATSASVVISPTVTTTYSVTGSNSLNCSSTVTITQVVSTCAGLNSQFATTPIMTIYPNPGNGIFNLNMSSPVNNQVEVLNSLGQIVYSASTEHDNTIIDLSFVPAGIYFVIAKENNVQRGVIKIIKQ